MQQFFAFALHHTRYGYASPPAYHFCDVVGCHFFSHHGLSSLCVVQLLLYVSDVVFQHFQFSVSYLRHALIVAFAFGPFRFEAQLLHTLFVLLNLVHECALAFPFCAILFFLIAQFGYVLVERSEFCSVVLAFYGLSFNLQLFEFSLNLVKLFRHRVAFHPQFGRSLVHQVDSLVGQEAVAYVPFRQLHGCYAGVVLYTHLVMVFVTLFQSAQNADGTQFVGFVYHHRLKTSFQGFVFLEILLIFVECRGTYRAQFSACQCRFEDVGRVHGALSAAGTYKCVNLVDEQYYASFGLCHLVDYALQPFLKFAFIFRSGHQCTHVERIQLLVFQVLRHVATNDAFGQSLYDGCLSCSRFTYQYRVVLCAARQNLQHAAYLVVAAYHRVELSGACQFHHVLGIFRQRLIVVVGALRLNFSSLPQFVDGGEHVLFCHSSIFHYPRCCGIDCQQCRQQRFY